jgi:hypothetical protein
MRALAAMLVAMLALGGALLVVVVTPVPMADATAARTTTANTPAPLVLHDVDADAESPTPPAADDEEDWGERAGEEPGEPERLARLRHTAVRVPLAAYRGPLLEAPRGPPTSRDATAAQRPRAPPSLA